MLCTRTTLALLSLAAAVGAPFIKRVFTYYITCETNRRVRRGRCVHTLALK